MSNYPWDADRLRKAAMIRVAAKDFVDLLDKLQAKGALVRPTPAVLREIPAAIWWYIGLASYAQKTLKSVKGLKEQYGLSARPEAIASRLQKAPDKVKDVDLANLCKWLADDISSAIPEMYERDESYALHYAMIEGARIVGRGQNKGGDAAVGQFKRAVIEVTDADEWTFKTPSGAWKDVAGNLETALSSDFWRHKASGAMFDFRHGGNRPDVIVTKDGRPLMVGEIKGRKDLSNMWESWMPQVGGHMATWTGEFPDTLRGFFGTVVVENMLIGQSVRGTKHLGLQEMVANGQLSVASNLEKVGAGQGPQFDQFRRLIRHLTQ